MLQYFFGPILLLVVAIAAYSLLRYPHRGLPGVLSVDDLGALEGSLPGLKEVIVVADHVEDPKDELREAVKKNFRRGVRYHFLISDGNVANELDGYIRIFREMAHIEGTLAGISDRARDLVLIERLPYDWLEVPYIFYKIVREPTASDYQYMAVRGNQQREGIAEYYSHVDAAYAHMVARSILSDAPSKIVIAREELVDENVIDFDPEYKRRRSS